MSLDTAPSASAEAWPEHKGAPDKPSMYLVEAAKHAKDRVFPDSWIGRFLFDSLDFAARHPWAGTTQATEMAREVYRLQEAGIVVRP